MKILVVGSTGMLGSAVGKSLIEKYGEDNVTLTYRNPAIAYGKRTLKFDPLNNNTNYLFGSLPAFDWVINALGTIKPFMAEDPIGAIKINSVFPRELSNACTMCGYKMIHITTDCVYSGTKGKYTENDPADALDDYGKSKSLGEPNNCMVIRTSIIGEEIHKNASLVEWAKSQKDKPVKGFTNHLWNGVTTKEYANICTQIIDNNWYVPGTSHVFSNVVTKHNLLTLLNSRFQLNLQITATEAKDSVDRSLSTVKPLQNMLSIRTLEAQIMSM